ncbi:hypothetical protein EYF80_054914 [Liparis tanakae]|uniref:Uncharacterized protein n=1 Tax=Liparis tanakae TaxID=230148 RepID=A0A4Z2F2D2_9TELE|nr:hypothetical protein EYF80_054914 [Liparis tanakae]
MSFQTDFWEAGGVIVFALLIYFPAKFVPIWSFLFSALLSGTISAEGAVQLTTDGDVYWLHRHIISPPGPQWRDPMKLVNKWLHEL